MNQFQQYSSESKKNLKRVKRTVAKRYMHSVGYLSGTLTLPEYYKASGFEKMKLQSVGYSRGASNKPKRTRAIKLVSPKGTMSWRQFGLMHPYAYWHICNEITAANNWRKILKPLCANTGVSSYSVPPIYTQMKPQGAGITGWKNLTARDLPNDLSNHAYCASTDINNFYPSIYTHSIAWAVEGKTEARTDTGNVLLGNHLDKLFQNSRDGQTNGILVGSVISDIVAEILLSRIDEKLVKNIKAAKLDVIAVRYRDDYKFLCKNKSDAEKVLKIFSRTIQSEFDLTMNEKKTKVEDDVILASLRPWDLEYKSSQILSVVFDPKQRDFAAAKLIDAVLAAYELQARYPESRSGISILNRLAKKIEHNKKFTLKAHEAERIIPLLRKFILLREDVTPHAMLFIDQLLRFVDQNKKESIMRSMAGQFMSSEDSEYQEVWLYRVCIHHCPGLIDELFGKSISPLIVAISTKKPHYELFEASDTFEVSDIPELEKFSIIDKKALKKALSKPIVTKSIDPFRY